MLERKGTVWQKAAFARAASTKDLMSETGYDMSLLIDFWEPFETAMTPQQEPAKLLEMFQTDYISDTIVCYLRLVTAALLKKVNRQIITIAIDIWPPKWKSL